MTTTQNFTPQFQTASLIKRMLIGAGIGLALMLIFLLAADYSAQPEWGKYWMIRPLVIMTFGAAGGGACFYFLFLFFRYEGGWQKKVTLIVGIIGFIIALYLSFVLGVAGTMWH
jgi:ABC-type transport system involved in cytochrome c biogenesis permease subunit